MISRKSTIRRKAQAKQFGVGVNGGKAKTDGRQMYISAVPNIVEAQQTVPDEALVLKGYDFIKPVLPFHRI